MANKVPAKIDIGPMYNVDPQRRKAYTGEGLCTTHMSLQPFLVSRKFLRNFASPAACMQRSRGAVGCEDQASKWQSWNC